MSNLEEIHNYGIDTENREMYLFGQDTDDDSAHLNTYITSHTLRNIHILDRDNKPFIIHLHTWGGDWYCAMTLYDAVLACKSKVSIVCHGVCMSSGAILLQAAKQRISMPNCIFMVHEGTQKLDGTHKQVQSSLVVDKAARDNMIRIFAERCGRGPFFKGKTQNNIKAYIRGVLNRKEDWYLTSQDALEYGIIDAIRT